MNKNKASLKNKLYRKIHWYIYSKSTLKKCVVHFYPSYRHRNVKPGSDDISTLYITQIPNEGAGIGHQISNLNSGIHAAEVFGINFAYPGFRGKEDWEQFLGFNQNCKSIEELKKEGYKIRTLPYFHYEENSDKATNDSLELTRRIIKSYAGKKIIFNVNLDTFYRNQYEVIPYIKSRFEAAPERKNDKLIYNNNVINIAVHIRRGDINKGQLTGDKALTKRWLDMEYYENIIKKLVMNFEKPYCIYIFSEGDAKEYRAFEEYGTVKYCFDMSAMDSFLHMVRADYLVLSKSSFSYKPALLSDGIRICPPGFWHGYPDNEKWIVADENGEFEV